jgi:chemotaxis protein methyltransferase CheR
MLKDQYPHIRFALFDTLGEVLEAVASGKADATVTNLTLGTYLINKRGFTNLKVAGPSPLGNQFFRFAIRKDWPELAGIIDKGLDTISAEERSAIHGRYLSPVKYEHGITSADVLKWILLVVGAASVILLCFVFWNRLLKKQVRARTSELTVINKSLEDEIGERRRAEEKLRYQATLLENVSDAVISVDMDFKIRSWNDTAENIYGWKAEEVIGKLFSEVTALEYLDEKREEVLGEVHRKGVWRGEVMQSRKDGKRIFVQTTLSSIKDKEGVPIGFVGVNRDITERKMAEIELRGAFAEIDQLKNQLEAESAYLQDEIKLEHNFENIIGQSEALKYVLHRLEQVAPLDSPVLIMGETGTGKELMARALHRLSPYGKRALVKVNCAALPGELIESELFGREKGAFTGATTTQLGRFELAKGSTLFLDEIGELPLELQPKLLRVLESGEFERLGSSVTLHSDARIIAATNRVLEEEVRQGRFREDLWYRLKVFPITVPPLREHPEDIPLLVKWFVGQLARKMGKRTAEIPKLAMQVLQNYSWPGNVRELEHAIEGAIISAQGKKLNFELPKIADAALSDYKFLEEMERDYILQVLKAKNWRIGGEDSAASTLGMHVNTLRARMKKLGIQKPKP